MLPCCLEWAASTRPVSQFDGEESHVYRTFERFWIEAVHGEALKFDNVATALEYLRACLHGAILDTMRSYSRPQAVIVGIELS